MLFNSFVLEKKESLSILWIIFILKLRKGTLKYFSLTSDRLHNKRNLKISLNWVWQNHHTHQEMQSLDLRVWDQILMFYLLQSRICHPKIISITFSLPPVYLEFILNWLYLVFSLERKSQHIVTLRLKGQIIAQIFYNIISSPKTYLFGFSLYWLK